MTEYPDITFRDGPTGPRAALLDGPDVWEVTQTIDSHPGDREEIEARIKLNAQTRQSWGDLSKFVAATTAETLRRLDAEERAAGFDPW